jgi:hypothetical protein
LHTSARLSKPPVELCRCGSQICLSDRHKFCVKFGKKYGFSSVTIFFRELIVNQYLLEIKLKLVGQTATDTALSLAVESSHNCCPYVSLQPNAAFPLQSQKTSFSLPETVLTPTHLLLSPAALTARVGAISWLPVQSLVSSLISIAALPTGLFTSSMTSCPNASSVVDPQFETWV